LAGSLSYGVEAGAEELGVVLGAGTSAGALALLSLAAEGSFVSDEAAPFPDSDTAPGPDSAPDSEAESLVLAA
jgi:hypothetical protein